MDSLETVAPAFVDMAHQIVWATAATVNSAGEPTTRILHPIWEWDGTALTGWILTSPSSPKATDLRATPAASLTYWTPNQDTCTADCGAVFEEGAAARRAGWDRFANGPEPVGYDPSIIPFWPDPDAAEFGVLRLTPTRLRVMPGTLMAGGGGELLTWRA